MQTHVCTQTTMHIYAYIWYAHIYKIIRIREYAQPWIYTHTYMHTHNKCAWAYLHMYIHQPTMYEKIKSWAHIDGSAQNCCNHHRSPALSTPVGATVQPAALPEISAGPADPAAPERYRWNRCIQVRQLDAAVNWDISCSCVSNSSNAAASPATQICKSFQTICF